VFARINVTLATAVLSEIADMTRHMYISVCVCVCVCVCTYA
jgi:hypothetical protein